MLISQARNKARVFKEETQKKELKINQVQSYPDRDGSSTGGDGSVTPGGRGEVPSGIRYLGNKFEVQGNSIKKNPVRDGLCPGRFRLLHRTK